MTVPPRAFEVITEEGRLAARVVANQTITTNLRVQIVPGQEDFVNRMLSDYGATQSTG